MFLGGRIAGRADDTASFDSVSPWRAPPHQSCSPRGWYSLAPWLGLRRAPVSRNCHAHTNARSRASYCCCYGVAVLRLVVMLLLLLPSLASPLSFLVAKKRKSERKQYDLKRKDEKELLWIQKWKRTAVLVAGKTKQRQNEKTRKNKKRTSYPTTKQRTSGGFPNKYFPRRQLRAEKGWDGRICRSCPPKSAISA